MHQATEVTQVRPIAVGHAIYRLWGRIRLQQMAPFFANHLPPFQSGGCAGADLESMLVSLSLDLPGDTYQVGLALDFSKAFDPTGAYCALRALKSRGLPDSITNLLGNHWLDHFRWRGGPEAMMGCCSLPQGDVWSPLRLAPPLAATLRKQQQDFPQMGQMLYFDDRTILGALPAVVKQIKAAWDEFPALTRLKTHPGKHRAESKRQLEPNYREWGEVLGAIETWCRVVNKVVANLRP